jgi:biopolymer transport protein ExbD
MRKITLVVVLLAACGRKHPAQAPPTPSVTIAITADGFVKVDGKAVALDELGTFLAARRDAAPLVEIGWGVKASPLPVLLDVEDGALWRHVMWVTTVLAEQKFWRLSFPGGREAPLPTSGITHCGAPDGKALLVRVLVFENGTYALGDRTTRDAKTISTWIDAAPPDGTLRRIGAIGAQPRVAWGLIRPAFDALRSRGVDQIEFAGAVPRLDSRGRSPLPPPRPLRLPMRWSGLFLVDYWSHDGYYELPPGADADEITYDDPLEAEPDEPVEPQGGMVGLVNEHRRSLELPSLGFDRTLADAALAHAEEMGRLGYFGHFSPVPGNHSPGDRLAKLGWPEERRHAELLAKADCAEAAFAAILARPENAKLLADPAFRLAGVAQSGDCWVVLLGAER